MTNWIKKGFVTFSLASTNVEKQSLNQLDNEMGVTPVVSPYQTNNVMRDLKEGVVTQQVKEFRKHYYQVLQASEKYKTIWGKDGDFRVITEDEIKTNRVAKGDPYDNYPVEVSIDNSNRTNSLFEETTIKPVKVSRHSNPNCRIEEHTNQIHVRDIDGKTKLLDFYIENSPENRLAILEARRLMDVPGITDFNNIHNLSFTTPGGNGMTFSYNIVAFDKVVQYNNNMIVKMFAEVVNPGTWIGEKYMNLND